MGAHPDAEKALRTEMTTPIDTPTQCLVKATAMKEEGNAALRVGNYEDALHSYEMAFACIFMRVNGRTREVHGESLFNAVLDQPLGNERHGQVVYFLLRTTLVANVVEVYLKMKLWAEAQFWGLRSINLLRGIAGDAASQPTGQIPGPTVWGKVSTKTSLRMQVRSIS